MRDPLTCRAGHYVQPDVDAWFAPARLVNADPEAAADLAVFLARAAGRAS